MPKIYAISKNHMLLSCENDSELVREANYLLDREDIQEPEEAIKLLRKNEYKVKEIVECPECFSLDIELEDDETSIACLGECGSITDIIDLI